MNLGMIPSHQIIIRPPVEAYSILIPVTGGCSWNRCRFCNTYHQEHNVNSTVLQKYEIRPLPAIKADIRSAQLRQPGNPYLFLAGGNAFSTPTATLTEICRYIKEKFPENQRISTYAKVLDIQQKSDTELQQLATAGLSICYIGMESGSDPVLRYMRKGHTASMIEQAIPRLQSPGIKASVYILLGLGGKRWTKNHAIDTAHILNKIRPDVIRFRTLNIMPGSGLIQAIKSGEFHPLSPYEFLQEEYQILQNLKSSLTSDLYHDHISNYLTFRTSNIGRDKTQFLTQIQNLLDNPEVRQWEPKRLQSM